MSSSNTQVMYSVYIPTISKVNTEEIISNYFALNFVGKVERVDFVEHPSHAKGLHSDLKDFQQAFVHFTPQQKTHEIMEAIEKRGSYWFYPCEKPTNTGSVKEQNEYWILLKNKNPIPKTELNVDQVAHNFKLMEERETKLVQKIAEMEKRETQMVQRMEEMEEKMSILIQLNEKFTKTFDVHTINIKTLSDLLIKKEQTKPKEKCRICSKVDVNDNESICIDCWKYCEPAVPLTKTGIEAIEKEFCNLKTDAEERYWRLYQKTEDLAQDVSTLYDRLWLDVEKLIKKTDKNIADIEYSNERTFNLTEKVNNIGKQLTQFTSSINIEALTMFSKAHKD